jgi:predicted nuclease with TOPRIM domain
MLGEINECTEKINEKHRNLNQKLEECDNLNREKNTIELRIKELDHKKANFNEQLAKWNRQVSCLKMIALLIESVSSFYNLASRAFG